MGAFETETGQLREDITTDDRKIAKEGNLEKIILLPTWREVLMEMVQKDHIDPWDVDVVKVSSRYLEKIKKMQMDDLRIPANLILAAAILLRFKSDLLNLDEPEVQSTLDDYTDEFSSVDEIPMLELKGRIPPKGRVTLDELVDAVERVFENQEKRDKRIRKAIEIEPVTALKIKTSEFDINTEMENVLKRIKKNIDVKNLVLFSSLLREKTKKEVIYNLLPLLFLSQRGDISIRQDPFFGEIFIRIIKD